MKKSRGKRIRLQASERLNRRVRDAGESSEVHIINFIIKFISATPLCGPQKKKKTRRKKQRKMCQNANAVGKCSLLCTPSSKHLAFIPLSKSQTKLSSRNVFRFFFTIFAAISFKISGRCKLGPQKLVTNWQVLSCCVGGGRGGFRPY